jgi:transporter family-2 protein
MILSIIFSILSGVTIVLSRTTNALLSQKSNTLVSTYYNYIIGLIFSFIALVLFANNEISYFAHTSYPAFYYYLGGPLGIIVVALSAYLAIRISSLIMTILMFFGQITAAVLLDWMLSGNLDLSNVIGGVFVFIGLLFINQKS